MIRPPTISPLLTNNGLDLVLFTWVIFMLVGLSSYWVQERFPHLHWNLFKGRMAACTSLFILRDLRDGEDTQWLHTSLLIVWKGKDYRVEFREKEKEFKCTQYQTPYFKDLVTILSNPILTNCVLMLCDSYYHLWQRQFLCFWGYQNEVTHWIPLRHRVPTLVRLHFCHM